MSLGEAMHMPACRARLVTYEGRAYPSCTLAQLLGVGRLTLLRWVAQGGVSAAKVEQHRQERAQRLEAREKARAVGVQANTVYQRVMRGETLAEASTRRALSRAEVCERMRAAKGRAA